MIEKIKATIGNMKKSTKIVIAIIISLSLIICFTNIIMRSMLIGDWEAENSFSELHFFSGGFGKDCATSFTWKIIGNKVYVSFEDTRSAGSYLSGWPNSEWVTIHSGRAPYTEIFRFNFFSSPQKLEAIDATHDYEKVD